MAGIVLPTVGVEADQRPLRLPHGRSVSKSPELATRAVCTVPSVTTTSPAPTVEVGKNPVAILKLVKREHFPLQSGKSHPIVRG